VSNVHLEFAVSYLPDFSIADQFYLMPIPLTIKLGITDELDGPDRSSREAARPHMLAVAEAAA
jgi:hypothetical protein